MDATYTVAVRRDGPFATYLELPGSHELLGTRRAVRVAGTIDGQPFAATLLPSGTGPHRLPLRAGLRTAAGRDRAGELLTVRLLQRFG
nr:DUF1905 domain-containing protein [Kineococcus siccus]